MQSGESTPTGWRISVDTGGTFTDVVIATNAAADNSGQLFVGKALTTPERIYTGLRLALTRAAEAAGVSLEQALCAASLFIYGTTRATNAIVTGQTARTAFLTTAGFPDVLVLREGGKFNPHDFSKAYPAPYIPRRHTFEINERVSASGEVLRALDEHAAAAVIEQIAAQDFEACAISLLWSTANPVHELRLQQMLKAALPSLPVTLSHALNPILREYRRASSTAIDASLKPLMQSHLRELEEDLRADHYAGEILVSTTIGGCLDIDSVIEAPIHTVRSGPAMGPVAGRRHAELEAGQGALNTDSVLVVDTGGTTFDVSLVREGSISINQETWIGERFTGHMLGMPAVDARSVGAGGGSIAWLDDAGLIHVGPHSAGADPGPACYGRGGSAPTVTDCALVLGYINPDYFLGGQMQLDPAAAGRALEQIAKPLGISVEQAAFSVFAVSNETMINAIKDITVSEGIDPREAWIVAGGGAAGLNIMPIASELECRGVIVPRTASVLSASGMQFSDIQSEVGATLPMRSDTFKRDAVNHLLGELDNQLDRFATKLAARGFQQSSRHYRVEAHYDSQVWDISVPLAAHQLDDETAVDALIENFHASHQRIFSVEDRASVIEFLNWRARLSVHLPAVAVNAEPAQCASTLNQRSVLFGINEVRDTPIIRGECVAPGDNIAGPAIIEESTTTVVLPPGLSATLSAANSYVVTLDGDTRHE